MVRLSPAARFTRMRRPDPLAGVWDTEIVPMLESASAHPRGGYRRFVDEVVGQRNARNRKRIEIECAPGAPIIDRRFRRQRISYRRMRAGFQHPLKPQPVVQVLRNLSSGINATQLVIQALHQCLPAPAFGSK